MATKCAFASFSTLHALKATIVAELAAIAADKVAKMAAFQIKIAKSKNINEKT